MGDAVMIEDASRGLRVTFSRRDNIEFAEVEMRVEKIGDKKNIGLMNSSGILTQGNWVPSRSL
jgi:hypothetical protein